MRREKFAKALGRGRLRGLVVLALAPALLWLGCCSVSLWNTVTPAGIVIHHSAVPRSPGGRPVDSSVIDGIHRRRGFGAFYWGRVYHIGYHYVILPDGTIQKGRPDGCRGAHAAGYNSYIGICLVGNFSSGRGTSGEYGAEEPTPAQLNALVALCRQLQAEHSIPAEQVITHKEVNPETECPGDRFPFLKVAESVGRSVE
ncbi:MAG TPA: peptidoglycan recognition family protein [Pyrinomonadaceae bacterium]|jgi:hypothetical protein